MSDHDPLCQWANTPTHGDRAASCQRCALIARVRADERERLYSAAKADSGAMFGIVLAAEQIEAEVRERLRAQVEAWGDPEDEWDAARKFDAVLRLLGGTP